MATVHVPYDVVQNIRIEREYEQFVGPIEDDDDDTVVNEFFPDLNTLAEMSEDCI